MPRMERCLLLAVPFDCSATLILGVAFVDSGLLNIFIANLLGFDTALILIFPTAALFFGVVFLDALCFFFNSGRMIR